MLFFPVTRLIRNYLPGGTGCDDVGTAYRNTAQRAMVLSEVQAADRHLTAGEIFERVRRKDPKLAYGTVYRALHVLADHDIIQELTFADQASRFDKRVDRHDHVQCVGCGLLLDADVPVALFARYVAEEQTGFTIHDHHTVFTGQCPQCQAATRLDDYRSSLPGRPKSESKF
ncbi:MAG: Fur family transcriptional regulator [Thermomicrobiales bacterium]